MGNCLPDVKGGQQAVGGDRGNLSHHGPHVVSGGGATTYNDAVDLFFRNKGMNTLYTQIEVQINSRICLQGESVGIRVSWSPKKF